MGQGSVCGCSNAEELQSSAASMLGFMQCCPRNAPDVNIVSLQAADGLHEPQIGAQETREEAAVFEPMRKAGTASFEEVSSEVEASEDPGDEKNSAAPKDRNPKSQAKKKAKAQPPSSEQLPAQSPKSDLPPEVQRQVDLGPQSKRGNAAQGPITDLQFLNPHAWSCFETCNANEQSLCGEYAVFYHAYSHAALVYEVQAAVAEIWHGFQSEQASLPRLLVKDFEQISTAKMLMEQFEARFARDFQDHHREYRAVAISVMCSLVALGPEVSPPVLFLTGYSCEDINLPTILKEVLTACCVPEDQRKKLTAELVRLGHKHNLDVSCYSGKPRSENVKPGHLLQIFVRRDLLDEVAYSSKPYGELDEERHPLSKWLNGDAKASWGQARLVAHPTLFTDPECVKMYVVSADPDFHSTRQAFQKELKALIGGAMKGEGKVGQQLAPKVAK
eukprot:TRINITY_DN13194_c0_g1_i1.p1 TRINITY_DN13194_c0_g1~~TRINITY_DN13194_c0_g1_i1.p1  ORF type:complete len:459 (+),score=91.91 TRINITY_DN13194_c0_g1_i1:40-1377(+)